MYVSKDERLFNVDQVTAYGIQRIASLLLRDSAQAYLDAARIERRPGVCTRVYLASREAAPAAKMPHGIGISKRPKSLSPAKRAAVMAKAELCDE